MTFTLHLLWDGGQSVGAHFLPFTPVPKPTRLKLGGVSINSFRLQIAAEAGREVEIQTSSDFRSWETLVQRTIEDQPADVEDSAAANHSRRFFRAVRKE